MTNLRAVFLLPIVLIVGGILPADATDPTAKKPRSGEGAWKVTGTRADDPRYAVLLRVLERARTSAGRRLASELGLVPFPMRPIEWDLEVDATLSEAAFSVPGFLTAGRTVVEPGGVRVTLPAPRYLARPESAALVVAHEACHAVLASVLGGTRYNALPQWFREGMALWFSGEGSTRVDEQIALTVFGGAASDSFLVGASLVSDGSGVSAAEAFLAFDGLWLQIGAAGRSELVAGLRGGWTLPHAVRELSGWSPVQWQVAALKDARKRIRARLPRQDESRFRASLELRGQGQSEAAARIWTALREGASTGSLRGTLDYLLTGQRLERARRTRGPDASVTAKLRDDLRAIVGPGTHLWQPELLILLGDTLRLRGEISASEAAYREVVEAYPQDGKSRARALRRLSEPQPRAAAGR